MGKALKVVLLVWVVLYSLVLFARLSGQASPSLKDLVPLIAPLAVLFLPLLESRKAKPFYLPSSFKSGVYGGLIGGFLAGTIIGVGYYLDSRSSGAALPWSIIPEVMLYASLFVGAITGGATLYLIYWFRYLVDEKDYPALLFNELSGGLLAGLIGVGVAGAIGGYWFGGRTDDPVSIPLLIWGGVGGSMLVVFGALRYDFHGNLRNLWRAFVMSTLAAIFLGVAGIFLVNIYKMDSFLRMGNTPENAILGGVYLGAAVGLILGSEIGLALLLYRLMEVRKDVLE